MRKSRYVEIDLLLFLALHAHCSYSSEVHIMQINLHRFEIWMVSNRYYCVMCGA